MVTTAASQALGMALHELATNASKYGALSVPAGRVEIAWDITLEGEERRFTMAWTERDGPPAVKPGQRGFGTTVIVDMVRMSLDGAVSLDYPAEGLRWRVDCPASRVLDGDDAPLAGGGATAP